jgi:hypothetical protein
LDASPPLRLSDGSVHCGGEARGVGVEERRAADVPSGAADGLDERRLGAEEALLVGRHDGDEGDLCEGRVRGGRGGQYMYGGSASAREEAVE